MTLTFESTKGSVNTRKPCTQQRSGESRFRCAIESCKGVVGEWSRRVGGVGHGGSAAA